MLKTLWAVFDGEALRPEEPVDLQLNKRYAITIEDEIKETETPEEETYPLTEILGLAADMGVTDLSTHHGWYAHGCPQDESGI